MAKTADRLGHHKLILGFDLLIFALMSLLFATYIYDVPFSTYTAQMLPALVVVAVSMYLLSVFEISLDVSLSSLISRTILSVLLALSILLVVIYLLGPGSGRDVYGRGVLFLSMAGFSGYLLLTRYLLFRYVRRRKPFHEWVFVGDDQRFEQLHQELAQLNRHQIELQSDAWLMENLGRRAGQGVILDQQFDAGNTMAEKLINAKFNGINVTSLNQFYESFLERVPLYNIRDDWFFSSGGFGYINDSIRQRVKKTMDLFLVIITAPLTLTLFIISALLLIVVDRQNPIFTQQRTGQHGRVFTIYKLRTMRDSDVSSKTQWTINNDARVTAVGKLLRRYRLDELPQLLNVLKGNMSIVGPRPEQPDYTHVLSHQIPYYDVRHSVKPGITGWAQVRFPYAASVEDSRAKLEYDLYYIKNYSILLDLSILIKTVYTVVSGGGR